MFCNRTRFSRVSVDDVRTGSARALYLVPVPYTGLLLVYTFDSVAIAHAAAEPAPQTHSCPRRPIPLPHQGTARRAANPRPLCGGPCRVCAWNDLCVPDPVHSVCTATFWSECAPVLLGAVPFTVRVTACGILDIGETIGGSIPHRTTELLRQRGCTGGQRDNHSSKVTGHPRLGLGFAVRCAPGARTETPFQKSDQQINQNGGTTPSLAVEENNSGSLTIASLR